MKSLTSLTGGLAPRTIALTYGLGAGFGLAAHWAGLPLGMLLGAMLGITAASRLGLRPWGRDLAVPQKWRYVLVPVVGVAIGASFPEDFLTQARSWWVTMAALLAFIPLSQWIAYVVFRRLGGLAPPTAYFAAMPGGFIESLEMGEKSGADMPMLIMLQFLRIALCIVLIPIAFSLIEGHAVGAASGITLGTARGPLTAWDVAFLLALAVSGWAVATRLNFPAAVLSGPLLFSGAAHALGLTHAAPPIWTILVAQWIMGTSLGCRLAGFTRGQFGMALGLSALSVALMLGVAIAFALVLSGPVGQPVSAVVLAFAPGGVSEMSLIALSLHLSAVYVTMHHLARIILAVVTARLGQRLAGL